MVVDRMTLDALTKLLKHKDQSHVQHAVDYWVKVGVLYPDTDGSFVLLEVSAEQDMEKDGAGDLRESSETVFQISDTDAKYWASALALDEPVDLESAEEIRHDLHEKHWPVRTFT